MKAAGKIGLCTALAILLGPRFICAQDLPLTQQLTPSTLKQLDPTRNITHPILESSQHQPLPARQAGAGMCH